MKKALAILLTMTTVAGSSLTVFAAPETMPDGTVFDAEYYAQTYPDVVAALGTDRDALYNHYVTYGKAEGRSACAADVQQPVNVTVPSETKTGTTPTEVLAILDYYPEFMLTDSRPRQRISITDSGERRVDCDYDYDVYGNLVAEKYSSVYNNNIRDYTIDAEGKIIEIPEAIFKRKLIYNEQGQLTEIDGMIAGSGGEHLEYNEQGVLTKITDSSSEMVITYNEQKKPLYIYYENFYGVDCYKEDYVYDEQGKLIEKSRVYTEGKTESYTFNYDESGRLVSETDNIDSSWHFTHTYQYIY